MAIRFGTAATDWATSVTTGYHRRCLVYVRDCFNVAAHFDSAMLGWRGAKYRHTAGTPPAGVPVWWDYEPFGHVALSLGNGRIRSTDWPSRDKIGNTTIDELSRRWGRKYSGWSEDINKVRVYTRGSDQPQISLSRVIEAANNGSHHRHVLTVQKALKAEPGISLDYSSGPGWFGPRTKEAYQAWQQKLGFSGSDADGIPGRTSLTRLGSAHSFTVIG